MEEYRKELEAELKKAEERLEEVKDRVIREIRNTKNPDTIADYGACHCYKIEQITEAAVKIVMLQKQLRYIDFLIAKEKKEV